jgi:hypothetical protein
MTYGTRAFLDFQECGVFVVSDFQLFFIGKTANLGGWGSSEYLSIVDLKDVLILRSSVLFYMLSNFS